jgi:hypothetical protein
MLQRPLARQRALRALAEGAKPTLDLLADASSRSLRSLERDAEREGWALERAPIEDIVGRIRDIAARLLDQVEALTRAAAENGGKIEKGKVDAIVTLVRSLDKIGEIMRPEEVVKENQIRRDEKLADVLDRINNRILELARELAEKMVEQRGRAGGSGPRPE